MGHVDVSDVSVVLDDGTTLLHAVGFRVGDGETAALVGANGSGKTTLLRVIADELEPAAGRVVTSGGVALMPQFIGSVGEGVTVRELLLRMSPPRLREAAARVSATETAIADERQQLAYADALAGWSDAGGYDAEVLWDVCTRAALDLPLERTASRDVATLSGGEQKRLVLELLLRSPEEVLLLDEPDNYLDVPGKEWLEHRLLETPKTVLFISHDRELLARTATKIIAVEGRTAWTHGDGFATFHDARETRIERFEELHRRWREERDRLRALVVELRRQATMSDAMASRYRAMQTRLQKFEEAGPPPELPRRQNIRMRLGGSRTGVRAVVCEGLELVGLTQPFDTEVVYGERVAILGGNGTGKSQFLRLLAEGGDERSSVAHTGRCRLGARVVPGHFAQTHQHPEWRGRPLVDLLAREGVPLDRAMGMLKRYELLNQARQRFDTLSGGQQARFQILVLEVRATTLLLLDEPTDNLDVDSAEALENALAEYAGTVLAVTHDRWFAKQFDRYLAFGSDGRVYESADPVWHEPERAIRSAR